MAIKQGLPSDGDVFDVCVVGSGPAGLAIALACGRRGHSVLVLEAGGRRKASSAPNPVDILDADAHAPLTVSTREGFGGTSSAWGGLCVPYDPIDFAERSWASAAQWPITYAEAAKWHTEAGQFLDCGVSFEDTETPLADNQDLDVGQLGRLSRRSELGKVYYNAIATSRSITLCLNAPAVNIACDPTGTHVVGVDVGMEQGTKRVLARRVVLAAGGLRTTRLLLSLARAWPRRFAADTVPLGKYYMGHLTGEIATLVFRDPRDAAGYLYGRDAAGRWGQRRVKLSPTRQKEEKLLNTAFTLRAPLFNDHRHGDGALSTIALLAPLLGKTHRVRSKRVCDTIAGSRSGGSLPHLRNILRRPASTVRSVSTALDRLRVKNLPVMMLNSSGRYSARYHAEQISNPNSRVFLDDRDPSRLVVDFRYLPADVDSVIRSHDLLDEGLRATGVGYLEYHVARDRRHDAVRAQARDGYHQIGTTRMSVDPRTGVVDRDCRVHGFTNLYVASASTLPTSGSANPTLLVVTMALRLAHHLSNLIERERVATVRC